MKKAVSVLLSAILTVCSAVTAFADESDDREGSPDVSAETYVLYCADNGQILAAKDENKRMKPASTTKIMTTLLDLEAAASCDETVTFTKEMAAEGSSMYLELGEKVRLSDLAVGMMMSSGNDAANAAALSLSDSFEDFSELMNGRAKQIGMDNTHFITPSGLDDDDHYSTAYDMALLMTYALENEDFAKLSAKKSAKVDFVEPEKHITYSNHNRLLSLYEYCIGGKTGYTMAAGRCLVSAARKDGLTLVCVTMNDRNDWDDHIKLYNYGFDNYFSENSNDSEFMAEIPCVGGTVDTVDVVGEKDISVVLPAKDKSKLERKVYIDSFLYAPIAKNQTVGRIDYIVDGNRVASVNVISADNVEIKKDNSIFNKIKELFSYG